MQNNPIFERVINIVGLEELKLIGFYSIIIYIGIVFLINNK
jgi:hypothetical protein